MKGPAKRLLLVILFAAIAFPHVVSATVTLDDLQKEYDLAHYQDAISLGRDFLSVEPIDGEDEVQVRRLLAFSYVALGFNDDAEDEFERILALDPGFELDPVLTSPKIISVFRTVRDRTKREEEIQLRPLDNTSAALRSALFPGLGQMYKGETTKGYVLAASEVALIGACIYSQLKLGDAHDEYLAAAEPQEMEEKYKTYNNWYRARLLFGGAALAVWAYSHLDAALRRSAPEEEKVGSLQLSVYPEARQISVGLSVAIR